MFHKHMYGDKLLTSNVWVQFKQMFVENGFEIYERREIVRIEIPKRTEAEKALENRRSVMNELMERTRNAYWRVEDEGSPEEKLEFIKHLKGSLEHILNK